MHERRGGQQSRTQLKTVKETWCSEPEELKKQVLLHYQIIGDILCFKVRALISCDVQEDALNLVEDSLHLWLIVLRNAPQPDPQLFAAFPQLEVIMKNSTGKPCHSHTSCNDSLNFAPLEWEKTKLISYNEPSPNRLEKHCEDRTKDDCHVRGLREREVIKFKVWHAQIDQHKKSIKTWPVVMLGKLALIECNEEKSTQKSERCWPLFIYSN